MAASTIIIAGAARARRSTLRETGLWVLKSNMLTIAIEKVDGKDDPRMDTYKVLSVDARTQSYVYLKTNFAYHANRVAADFEMPACDLTS